MTDHSPRKCAICGEYHCLAGCVPVEDCEVKADQKAYDKLAKQYGKIYGLTLNK